QFGDGDIGAESGDGTAKSVLELRLVQSSLHDDAHVGRDATAFEGGRFVVWKVDRAIHPVGNRVLKVVGADIGNDANDSAPLLVVTGKADVSANDVVTGGVKAGRGGANENDFRFGGKVGGAERASRGDGNVHQVEIIGGDNIHPDKR